MSQRFGLWTARLLTKLVLIASILGILTGIAVVSPEEAFAADDVSIFDVRKSLPLDPSDPVFYDFYVNAGPESGLKKGMYVSVVRKLPIHDPIGNKAQGTLSVEVAKLQIIHVERDISVARLASEFGSEDRPVLEFEAVMIGDVLDLSSVSMTAPKESEKRRKRSPSAADSSATASMETAAVTPAPEGAPAPAVPAPLPQSAEKPVTIPVPPLSPAAPTAPTAEIPSRPAPLPGMVRGDDDLHT